VPSTGLRALAAEFGERTFEVGAVPYAQTCAAGLARGSHASYR
jgi:hypothetical protein